MHYVRFNGYALGEARRQARLSFAQLEERSGVGERSIRHAENCEHVPSSMALMNLCAALGINPESLFVRS